MSASNLRDTSVSDLETRDTDVPPPASERKPLEQWAKQHKVSASEVEMVRLHRQWPIGREVTEQDFLAARQSAASIAIR